jgi:hypothetical protein
MGGYKAAAISQTGHHCGQTGDDCGKQYNAHQQNNPTPDGFDVTGLDGFCSHLIAFHFGWCEDRQRTANVRSHFPLT